MGNTEIRTSNQFGSIKLEFENDICVPSKQYFGTALISILMGIPYRSSTIEIYGVELSYDSLTKVPNVFLRQVIPFNLNVINGIAQPGKYVIPLSFSIDKNFPATFVSSIKGFKTEVKYFIKATIIDANNVILLQDIRPFRFIPLQPFIPNYAVAKSQEISGWFWRNRGKCNIEVIMNKNAIYATEPFPMNITLDSTNCELTMTRLQCTLFEHTTISNVLNGFAGMPSQRTKIQSWTLKGVPPRQKLSYIEFLTPVFEYQGRPLQSISSGFAKRIYILEFIPIFDTLGGDQKMSLETIIGICPLSSADFAKDVRVSMPPMRTNEFAKDGNNPRNSLPSLPVNDLPAQPVPPPVQNGTDEY